MRDSIIKNTGNSRYLKSAISAATTWEQFRAALIAGTLPIDLNGINTAGWQQVGDALNKANLLSDATVAALNAFLTSALPANPQVTDALNALATVGLGKIATGSYVGTGAAGQATPNTLNFGFAPKLVIITSDEATPKTIIFIRPNPNAARTSTTGTGYMNTTTWTDTGVSWYASGSQGSANTQFNQEVPYYYLAIG